MIIYSGMHRKSMEAAHTLSNDILKEKGAFPDDEDSRSSEENELTEQKPKIDEKDEFRSSSIAALRAKAQEHSAKMFGSFDRESRPCQPRNYDKNFFFKPSLRRILLHSCGCNRNAVSDHTQTHNFPED